MSKHLAAGVAAALLFASAPAQATVAIVFEVSSTNGMNGKFTAVMPYMPQGQNAWQIPSDYMISCQMNSGACGSNNGLMWNDLSGEHNDAVMFNSTPFYFKDGALNTPGVHEVEWATGVFARMTVYMDDYAAYSPNSDPVSTDPTGGVPEPSTWAMMILGFGLMGSLARKRALA